MKNRPICVFDFETDGVNPLTCNPVQLAALMIDGKKLNIIEGSEFCIDMQPPDINNESYLTNEIQGTINWHAKNYNTTAEAIIEKWKGAVDQRAAWEMFLNYFNKYNPKGTVYSAPMLGGMNIIDFDIPIFKRLMETYGTKDFFWKRDKADLLHLCYYWFESLDEPKAYNLDTLREYFGIEKDGGHDALKDVRDTADLLIRFLKLHRKCTTKVKFKNACNHVVDTDS